MLNYESIWLNVGNAEQHLVEISHIKFQQYLWKGLWDIRKRLFMAWCNSGRIVDHSG
jgi:hypothetical protein